MGNQTATFLYAVLFGCLICLLYDVFRLVRVTKKYTVLSVFVQDILFWALVTFLTFLFLLSRTNGALRGFVIVGQILGFIIFRCTFSDWLFPLFAKFFLSLARFSTCIEHKKTALLRRFTTFLEKVVKITGKKLKKGLKTMGHLLYTKRKSKNKIYVEK